MISTLLRKVRTLADIVQDFYGHSLASFRELDRGLEERGNVPAPELVSRVVCSYEAAKTDQRSAGRDYQANGEWITLIEGRLKAFQNRGSLGDVLSSFFRNEDTFSGLADYATLPYLKSRGSVMTRMIFVNSMLHDYRVWSDLTGKKIEQIRTPCAGNPFGYFIEGTLAIPGNFRHHYTAEKAVMLMGGQGVVAELGGGWGDVGFFALRSPGVHYVNFDLPEILLLASYWLCSALPNAKIVLYGEEDPKTVLAHVDRYDAVLFPNYCLPLLPERSVDVFVNTHSLSEMSSDTIKEYLGQIGRTCRKYFFHENSDKEHRALGHTEVPASQFSVDGFRVLNKALSPWKSGGGRYREFLCERITG